jgi:hypothetical protein
MGPYPAGVPASDGFIVGELYTIRNESEFGGPLASLMTMKGVSFEPAKFSYSNVNWLKFL